jgi:hypothetical protein
MLRGNFFDADRHTCNGEFTGLGKRDAGDAGRASAADGGFLRTMLRRSSRVLFCGRWCGLGFSDDGWFSGEWRAVGICQLLTGGFLSQQSLFDGLGFQRRSFRLDPRHIPQVPHGLSQSWGESAKQASELGRLAFPIDESIDFASEHPRILEARIGAPLQAMAQQSLNRGGNAANGAYGSIADGFDEPIGVPPRKQWVPGEQLEEQYTQGKYIGG